MITLVVGSTGAGKTTYARELAKRLPAVVYSIDEWMRDLYWQEMPSQPDMAWFEANQKWYLERIDRCEQRILQESLQRAQIGQKSILDLGFSTREHRVRFIKAFQSFGIKVEQHFLNIDPVLRWQRVQERNNEKGSTFVMHVDQGMFDFMEGLFEPPSDAEGATVVVLDESGSRRSPGLRLEPMTNAEFAAWIERSKRTYADDKARANGWTLEKALEVAEYDFTRFLPNGLATPRTSLLTIRGDLGEQLGFLWMGVKDDPKQAYVFDILIEEAFRGRGYGKAAMIAAEAQAKSTGFSSIGLHVFGSNTRAISLYKSLGYSVVDQVMSKEI